MNKNQHTKNVRKIRRRIRVRARIWGTKDRPRLSVYRSLRYLHPQLIDDDGKKTLLGVSQKEFSVEEKLKKTDIAKNFGKFFAEKAILLGYKKIIFDKGSSLYHGRIKAFADGAREKGLEF